MTVSEKLKENIILRISRVPAAEDAEQMEDLSGAMRRTEIMCQKENTPYGAEDKGKKSLKGL